MKQKIRIVAMAALVAAVGLGSYMYGRQETNMTDLMLENVEALAAGEIVGTISCFGVGCVECPTTHRKVYIVKTGYAL